ncbi:transmembrane signal receptor [Lithospermum erythrorhizon]|uniref:Transmembrane signal receptor n=1 Tax=Lithospermum erythrorhizon TaxID=34254 RepID=A0AAV3RNI4_LITER
MRVLSISRLDLWYLVIIRRKGLTILIAPVAKMVTVRTFLALAAARGWILHQMEMHNAFYMEISIRSRPAAFPIEPNHKLGSSVSAQLVEGEKYRRLVGRLIYLSYTRPDIAYVVHILSQFLQEPREDHWNVELRALRYLKNSPGQGILLRADSDLRLSGWCDLEWTSCPVTRRSVIDWVVFLGDSLTSWKIKK